MMALVIALVLVGPEVLPDCQRFCLGQCHYDRKHRRCADSRVEYIGTWDAVPADYKPAEERDFPVYALQAPEEFGKHFAEGGDFDRQLPVAPPPNPTAKSCCTTQHTEE